MRKINLLFILLSSHFLFAQQQTLLPNFKQLEVTTSPAYVLLGIQPTNITRPSGPREFVTSLHYVNINGVLQPSFAMEANPFNWSPKSEGRDSFKFKATDYFDKKLLPAITKNFSFSLATSNTDSVILGGLGKGTGLGFGFQTTIVPGIVNRNSVNKYQQLLVVRYKEMLLEELKDALEFVKEGVIPLELFDRSLNEPVVGFKSENA